MSLVDIAVVILNWNGKKHLEKYLPSVVEHSNDASIIIIDNNSTDDSLLFLSEKYKQIEVIKLDENHGFCQGYNLGLLQLEGRFKHYLLLNSDIEVTEDYLSTLYACLQEHPETAACQPKVLSYKDKSKFEHAGAGGGFIDKLGYPFCRGRVFDHAEKDNNQYNKDSEIFWATGACMLIKADVFHDNNGFDPSFFAHMEEIDLCWRLQNRGYTIRYKADAVVYHLGGGTLQYNNPFKTFLNFRNGLMLLTNNLPTQKFKRTIFKRLCLDGMAAFHFLLLGYWKDFIAVLKAHYSFYSLYPKWSKKRKDNLKKATNYPQKHIHQKLIVFEYFIQKKKTYDQL